MSKRMAVILAAGKGTRMKSKLYKVLHPICGLPMVDHVVRALEASQVERKVAIVGHGAEDVRLILGDRCEYALQEEQLGTGHAVLQAEDLIGEAEGNTLVICGDTPLLTAQTLSELFEAHEASGAGATILSAIATDPSGYGRVVRNEAASVESIVEDKDASPEQLKIQEINTGTYIFKNRLLFELLHQVTNDNAQGEYYLPDVIELMLAAGEAVEAHAMDDLSEGMGINDRVALAEATALMQDRIIKGHLLNGVTIVNPASTTIEADVKIGSDTVIEAGVILRGQTTIGQDCQIGANTEIHDSQIADQVEVWHSVIESSIVKDKVTIGPYAHLRPNSILEEEVHIGNFVEIKNASLGRKTRAGHLTYVGDATIGENVNLGCGTIFVNYDGVRKHHAYVGADSFIGCNTNIIAPIEIAEQTVIAAGSTVNADVPKGALAISRVRQENIADYWKVFTNK